MTAAAAAETAMLYTQEINARKQTATVFTQESDHSQQARQFSHRLPFNSVDSRCN